jgi:heme-degrading monooxygenase HmoA
MIDAGIDHVRDVVMPAMSHIDGFVGLSLMVDRDSGRCVATSAWRTEEAMRASASTVENIRQQAADAFGGSVQVDEWEAAVMHRAHHAYTGSCMRATWLRSDPDQLDRAIDLFKLGTLPEVEDLEGFCSASLLVNRADGRAVVTVAYRDRDALERNREMAHRIRERTMQEANLELLDVGEYDLALGHLHIPETV